MSEGTSSKWFENQFDLEPQPDVPVITWGSLGRTLSNIGVNMHLNLTSYIQPLIQITNKINAIAEKQIKAATPYTEGKPAHWQAPHPRELIYDHRGRKRY